MKSQVGRVLIVVTAVQLAAICSTFALGIRLPSQGAAATGQSDAFVAQADDATALFYNPAGVTQITGSEIAVGSWNWFPDYRFEGVGTKGRMDKPALTPHFYAVSDLGLLRWRFGIAANPVFGTAVDWRDTPSFRFLVTKANLTVLSIAPSVAYQVNDHLSVGASLNIYYGNSELENNVMLAPPPFPEGHFRFSGDGVGVGATLGLLWKINTRNSLGVVYRSPFSIEAEGSAEITHPLAGIPDSPTSAQFNFPQIVTAGYAFRPIMNLKLEADIEWLNYDSVNEIRFHSSNPAFDGNRIPLNWKDSFCYRFGTEYKLNDHWAIRAGYAYSENSVPDKTFSPLVPDLTYHSFTLGAGYSKPKWGVDVAYQCYISKPRNVSGSINSPAVDGEWECQNHAFIVTANLKF